MSKLVWDKTGERFYETGVDHVVLYPYDSEKKGYGTGVAWNGVSAINESPSGAEANAVYADNIKYLNLISAEDFGASIEAFTYPEEFEACNGMATVAPGVTVGQQTRKMFGLCYRTLIGNDTEGTNAGYKLNIVYNCMASPSEKNHQTVNDSPEAASMSWDISTTPETALDGFKPSATLVIDSTKTPAEKMAAIEALLYGTDSAEAQLPLPAAIVALIGQADA